MSYKILHTSDWHLGKKLFKKSRIPEQKLFLDWLVQTVIDYKVTHLLVSGDIFDIPNPPNDAVNLYFEFLNQISSETSCVVIIIPGNHDSSSFLSAPVQLLKKHNIFIKSGIEDFEENNHLYFENDNESLCIKTLPYFRSYELYNVIEKKDNAAVIIEDIETKVKSFINKWPKDLPERCRKVIMAHHAFGSPMATGSEQVLMLSGLESIPLSWIDNNFDYMALGHIHKPQMIDKSKHIYYSGSPIPMRFSEKHDKIVRFISWQNNDIIIDKIDIPIFRPIVQLYTTEETVFADIDHAIYHFTSTELNPFFEMNIRMKSPNNLLADKIEEYLKEKNVLLLSYLPEYSENPIENNIAQSSVHNRSIKELFEIYYHSKYPDSKDVPASLLSLFLNNLEEINSEAHLTENK